MNRHERRKESRRSGAPTSRMLNPAALRQFEGAVHLMKAGRWQEADAAHRRVLETSPRHSPSLHHLGLIAFKTGQAQEAIAALQLALDVEPNYHEARLNLAVIQKMQGAFSDALENCRRVTIAERNNAAAHIELGNILRDMGDKQGAISAYRRALALRPAQIPVEWNLAQCLADCGETAETIEVCRQILGRQPAHLLSRKLLIRALASLGKLDDAHQAIKAIDMTSEGQCALLIDAAIGLQSGGQSTQAVALLRDAIARNENAIDLQLQLGTILRDLGRLDEAFDILKKALDRDPTRADGYYSLGHVLSAQGAVNGAITTMRHALSLQPDFVAARIALGSLLQQAGMFEEALQIFRDELIRDPRNLEVRVAATDAARQVCAWDGLKEEETASLAELRSSNIVVFPFQLLGLSVSNDDMRILGRRHAERIAKSVRASTHPPAYHTYVKASGRIRLGYLSSDFCEHATSLLLAEVLELHDRDRFEVVGYCHSPEDGSALRLRIKSAFDRFEVIQNIGHYEAAEQIRTAGTEILVDLKGYTRGARQEILALRPAPIQVGYLGYPATTGASYLDYIIADATVAPLTEQPHYSEKIAQLKYCYQPNDRQRKIDPSPLTRVECGLPEEGFVFCSFNNNFKLNRTFFAIWMSLLDRVPGSVLWLLPKTSEAQTNLRKEAAAHGVDPARLVFASSLPHAQHLARHALADLFLDSLPCTAHTTASDALWAGLPLLTCLGPTFAGRVAASLLNAAGLPELIAETEDGYAAKALRLALNPGEMAELKAKVRAMRSTEPLFDTPTYVKSLEQVFTRMSQLYRTGQQPQSLPLDDHD